MGCAACESAMCFTTPSPFQRSLGYIEINHDTAARELGNSNMRTVDLVDSGWDLPRDLAVLQFLHRFVELAQAHNGGLQSQFA